MNKNENQRHEGSIVMYNRDRGFGFIQSRDFEEPLWFHFSFIVGADSSDLYSDLIHAADVSSILVSFRTRREARGMQAFDIQQLSEFLDIESLLISRDMHQSNLRERFVDLASMQALAHIDSFETLTQLVVPRIIHSARTWEQISTLARQWVEVESILANSIIHDKEAQAVIARFVGELANVLDFQSLADPDIRPEFPAIIQPLATVRSPLRCFRDAENVSLVILPNSRVFYSILTRGSRFIKAENKQMRMAVLLNEPEDFDDMIARATENGVVVISQRTIVEATLKDTLIPVLIGRELRKALPTHKLQPYEVGSAYDEFAFTGRSQERSRILESHEQNYAVYGGRKIGKTWFLKDICHRCQLDPYVLTYYPLYLSLQAAETTADAVNLVQEAVTHYIPIKLPREQKPITRLGYILQETHKTTQRTVLLALDEIDDVLRAKDGYLFFARLRQIQQTYPGAFKYVFAGFKELIQRLCEEISNDPFANWIGKNHFALGCLSKTDLQDLIVSPLQWLGFEFKPERVVKKIFELTSGHPYYAQVMCSSISGIRLSSDSNIIDEKNLERLASEEFFHDIFDIFTANLSPLQQLIGTIFAGRESSFSDLDIRDALRDRFGFEITEDRVRAEMRILQACSVFIRDGTGYKPLMQRINQEFFTRQDDHTLALRYLDGLEREV